MYRGKIVDIGELVQAFEEEELVVLFGTEVTEELRSICVIHETIEAKADPLRVGGKISFADQSYEITKVGDVANENFNELGHVSIYLREGENEVLPGAILVRPQKFPVMNIGDEIVIE